MKPHAPRARMRSALSDLEHEV